MDFEFLREFSSAGTVKLKTHVADAIRHGIIRGSSNQGCSCIRKKSLPPWG